MLRFNLWFPALIRRWGLVIVTLFALSILYRWWGGQVIGGKADLRHSGQQGQGGEQSNQCFFHNIHPFCIDS